VTLRPVSEQISDERRFQLLVEAVADYAIFLLDPQGRIASWNRGAEQIKGYSGEEIIGNHFSLFYTEADRVAGKPGRALATAQRTGRFEDEGWRVRKDGSRFWALVVVTAVRDERGVLIGFAKVTRDMTERREARRKLEEMREQLFQAQKMEAIGKLTGGIAHDFNNLLTVILGSVDLGDRLTGDNARLKRLLANMRHAALRGESLTKQLLAFSRGQPLRPEPVDLSSKLPVMCELLGRSLREDVAIVAGVAADIRPVHIDPSQFELAFLNVGLNSRDAMPDGGTLRVSARNVDLDGEPDTLVGAFVAIELSGVGMSDEVRSRAFEPFFTTEDMGRGSGLGVSQAFGFARQSGGTLRVTSAIGVGTTVAFFLPCRSLVGAPRAPAESHPVPIRAPRGAKVLLVEDEGSVAELAQSLLEGAGFRVTAVGDARAALDVLKSGAQVDVLFSDIMMPGGINGAELARIVRRDYPHIFILLATAYAEAAAGEIAQEFPLIVKPYGRDALLHQLGQILGESQ
jgi:PAS domain S-box-containing protein